LSRHLRGGTLPIRAAPGAQRSWHEPLRLRHSREVPALKRRDSCQRASIQAAPRHCVLSDATSTARSCRRSGATGPTCLTGSVTPGRHRGRTAGRARSLAGSIPSPRSLVPA